MKTLRIAMVMAVALVLTSFTPIMADSKYDFTLVNNTGYAISAVFVEPTKAPSWGSNILSHPLKDGHEVLITFNPAARAHNWSLKIKWEGYSSSSDVHWDDIHLGDIHRLTLHYNEKTHVTSAHQE